MEKDILYDNPSAPLVRFSSMESFDTDEDMTDEYSNTFESTLGLNENLSSKISSLSSRLEHSFQAFSLEDLVQSFDQTIHVSLLNDESSKSISTSSTRSKFVRHFYCSVIHSLLHSTWSDLIVNLRTSLRQDLKLPQLLMINSEVNDIPTIDGCNDEEEEFAQPPFLTAEQVLSEIDLMLDDMTPDSGYGDHVLGIEEQSIESLNVIVNELNQSIQSLSSILVKELAQRDEFEDEKEMKNTFIELLFRIQVSSFIQKANFLEIISRINVEHLFVIQITLTW